MIELAHADLEFRLKAGESALADDYIERYPQLEANPLIAQDLLAAEARFRAVPASASTLPSLDTANDSDRAVPSSQPYELLERLGTGAMGEVWKARQSGLNRVVALKMILPPGGEDPKAAIRFLAEAEAIAAVRHPNVVQVYDYGQQEGRPFLAMEYMGGGTLSQWLRTRRGLKPGTAATLVEKIARGVAAAHALGIVHRDLKPGNVLLDDGGEPKWPTSGSPNEARAAI